MLAGTHSIDGTFAQALAPRCDAERPGERVTGRLPLLYALTFATELPLNTPMPATPGGPEVRPDAAPPARSIWRRSWAARSAPSAADGSNSGISTGVGKGSGVPACGAR